MNGRILTQNGRPATAPDHAPLIRAVMYLDECLKRGVVVGVYEDSMQVNDADIKKALAGVRHELDKTIATMETLARAITRQLPNADRLQ